MWNEVHHTGRDQDQGYVALLIEDDADLLRFYQLRINSWGLPLNLVTAENGCEGLMRIGELQPDLIVTDLIMPGLDCSQERSGALLGRESRPARF